jgi:hypothetical protein
VWEEDADREWKKKTDFWGDTWSGFTPRKEKFPDLQNEWLEIRHVGIRVWGKKITDGFVDEKILYPLDRAGMGMNMGS